MSRFVLEACALLAILKKSPGRIKTYSLFVDQATKANRAVEIPIEQKEEAAIQWRNALAQY